MGNSPPERWKRLLAKAEEELAKALEELAKLDGKQPKEPKGERDGVMTTTKMTRSRASNVPFTPVLFEVSRAGRQYVPDILENAGVLNSIMVLS
jgi:hypothetical protein